MIVATGAHARQLGLESEQKLQGRGVSYCATCDASFFRDKVVVVVGGGDSAMEEATFVARFASKVYLVHRERTFARRRSWSTARTRDEKIEFVLNKVVVEVVGEDKLTGVRLRDTNTGEESELEADGLFVAIGHDPNTALFLDWLDHEPETGYLVTNGQVHGDEPPRRVRGGRRPGSRLPPGRHRGRLGLHGGARRRAVPRVRARPPSGGNSRDRS